MPCHNNLEEYLEAYIEAAGITGDREGPLWMCGARCAAGPSIPASRRRSAVTRFAGTTDYLNSGSRIKVAQRMAGHSNAGTTGVYDQRNDAVSLDEAERIAI